MGCLQDMDKIPHCHVPAWQEQVLYDYCRSATAFPSNAKSGESGR